MVRLRNKETREKISLLVGTAQNLHFFPRVRVAGVKMEKIYRFYSEKNSPFFSFLRGKFSIF